MISLNKVNIILFIVQNEFVHIFKENNFSNENSPQIIIKRLIFFFSNNRYFISIALENINNLVIEKKKIIQNRNGKPRQCTDNSPNIEYDGVEFGFVQNKQIDR